MYSKYIWGEKLSVLLTGWSCSSPVMYKGRVLLVFHGMAVCLTFIVEVKYMMETLTWVLVYIISVSQAWPQGSYPSSKIIATNANPVRYSSFGHDIWFYYFFFFFFGAFIVHEIGGNNGEKKVTWQRLELNMCGYNYIYKEGHNFATNWANKICILYFT